MMKGITALLPLCLLAEGAMAQCGPYKHHPVWPDTVGFAYLNLNECGPGTITSCLWDNGSTLYEADLPVGSHSVILFNGSTPVDTMDFNIDQDHWNLHQNAFSTFMGVEIDIDAAI